MAKKPVRAALGDVWLNCQVCKGDLFRLFVNRDIKLYRADK